MRGRASIAVAVAVAALPVWGACFNQRPSVAIVSPSTNALIYNGGTVNVVMNVHDRGRVNVQLFIDGVPLSSPRTFEADECDEGCTFSLGWNTVEESVGRHVLRAVAVDSAGARDEHQIAVDLEDIPLSLQITAPEDGVTIDHFDPVELTVSVVDDDATSLVVFVGEPPLLVAAGDFDGDGACVSGCTETLVWDTAGVPEGTHVLRASIAASDDATAEDEITVHIADTPASLLTSPVDGAFLPGVGQLAVELDVVDRSALDVSVTIDGELVPDAPTATDGPCAAGCTLTYPWLTEDYEDGDHEVTVVVRDPEGRESTASATVRLADIPYVRAIEVTDELDGSFLEVEVHLFDAETDLHLGCSGMGSGLQSVDASDVLYTALVGRFERSTSVHPLTFADIADREVYLQVIEDDGNPCPAPPTLGGGGDDLIGTSAPFAAADIAAGVMAFDAVVHLELGVGRPLTQ